MTPTFKACGKKCVHNVKSGANRYETGRKRKNIGIVMLTGQCSQFLVPTKGRPYMRILVGNHAHTIA